MSHSVPWTRIERLVRILQHRERADGHAVHSDKFDGEELSGMRSIFRHTPAALVALLALGALAAASASAAQPEISGASGSFSGSGGAITVNYEAGAEIKCSTSAIYGEFISTTEAWAKLTLEGCPKPAKVESTFLRGTLGYINKASGEVGLLLSPAEGNVFFPKFYPGETKLTESLIGHIGLLGQKSAKGVLEFRASGAKQIPLHFEGETFSHELHSVGSFEGGVAFQESDSLVYSSEVEFIGSEPTVETKTANTVQSTSATLNGAVNPEASATKYHFEYGTTTSYGSSTAEASAGEGTETLPESAGVTGLTAGTTYHYRLVATGNGRTAYGSDMSFTTGKPTLQLAKGSGAFPAAFSVSGGAMKFVSKNGLEVKCKAVAGAGKFTSVKEGRLSLKWKECTGPLGVSCKTIVSGEVETKELSTLLAYTYPEKATTEGRETGLVLSPTSGSVFAELQCGTVKSVIKGAVEAKITPLGTKTSTFALTMTQSKGVNALIGYETESGEILEAMLRCSTAEGKSEQSGLEESLAPTLTGEEGTIEGV
jgi:hypothetical protein